MSVDQHFLNTYLSLHLPKLGIDYETYGPYITGLIADDIIDKDGLGDVIELLKASTEIEEFQEKDDIWETLKDAILQLCEEEYKRRKEEEEKDALERRQRQAMSAMNLSEQAEELVKNENDKAKLQLQSQSQPSEDDAARRKILERYAYEDSGDESDDKEEDTKPVLDNRTVAKQAEAEKNQKLRKDFNESKKASKEASAKGKVEKSLAKEERKKRATKGERRR